MMCCQVNEMLQTTIGYVSQPAFMFHSFKNKKFENKVLFLWEQGYGYPDQQLPIFALTHSSD
jgi:hypothetical protein